MRAAAMGLRTAFSVQAKRTAPGSSSPLGPRMPSALQMQNAEQRKQPARGVEIDLDLAFQTLAQKRRTFVVQAAPPHVERFDLLRRRVANCLEVALADKEVVLDDAAKRREREHDAGVRRTVGEPHLEHETI